jgi:hypothetical protein
MVDSWFGGWDTALLCHCKARAHVLCHGWQIRFGPSAMETDTLICSCPCGHEAARSLAEKGILRPPPGWDVERFCLLLIDGAASRSQGES